MFGVEELGHAPVRVCGHDTFPQLHVLNLLKNKLLFRVPQDIQLGADNY